MQGERPYHSFFSLQILLYPSVSLEYSADLWWGEGIPSENDSYHLLSFIFNIYPVIPQFLQPQNCYVDGFEEIGEWDNKMAHGMLPLDQECEAFGEKMPERCNVPPHAPGED